jgi:hypothetical protein
MKKLLTAFGAAIAVTGCAADPLYKAPSNQRVDDYIETTELVGVDLIRKGNHDTWVYVNNRYIIYRGNKDYLIEFRKDCGDLNDNSWIPADYIHDHRNLRAGEDTIRGCIIENIYRISREQRSELRALNQAPQPGT